jgi:hypothetical protein
MSSDPLPQALIDGMILKPDRAQKGGGYKCYFMPIRFSPPKFWRRKPGFAVKIQDLNQKYSLTSRAYVASKLWTRANPIFTGLSYRVWTESVHLSATMNSTRIRLEHRKGRVMVTRQGTTAAWASTFVARGVCPQKAAVFKWTTHHLTFPNLATQNCHVETAASSGLSVYHLSLLILRSTFGTKES